MKDPVVSVCCLVYNHELYLHECLDGFIMQKTDFPFEVLIHDDASTDKSAEIIHEYEAKYPDIIKPIYQKENQYSKGISVSATYQFPRAKGKYIAMCEGDDYWTDPLKLQKQVDFLEDNNDIGLIYTDIDFYYQKSREFIPAVFRKNKIYRTTSFEDHLKNKGFLAPCTWLFRSEMIELFDNKQWGTDGSFTLLLEIFKHSKIYFFNEVTAVYRVSDGTASHPKTESSRYKYLKGVFDVQKRFLLKYSVSTKLTKEIKSNAYFSLLGVALRLNDQKFIEEAKSFFDEENIDFDSLLLVLRENIQMRENLKKIQSSKAYKMGKKVMKSFYTLKKMFKYAYSFGNRS